MSVEERAKEFQEMLSSSGYSGKYDDECISVFNEYINQLRQKLEEAEAEVEKFKFQAKENEIKWVGAADEIIRLNRIIREAREQQLYLNTTNKNGSETLYLCGLVFASTTAASQAMCLTSCASFYYQ